VLRIGTSGWQYRDWRRAVYGGSPTARWLGLYAQMFATVEVNSTFYRLPGEGTLGKWATATPEDFCFALKTSRYLTHIKRLRDPVEPVRRFRERLVELGAKLGCVLVQLPPTLVRDDARLTDTLDAFAAELPGIRVAFEPRHDSWHHDEVYDALASRDAALCWWDRRGKRGPLVKTASWIYVRFHAGRALPLPCYGNHALVRWCERIVEHAGDAVDGYVYFNNDHRACAPRNAAQLGRIAGRVGVAVSRLPATAPSTAA
jgi:uncharacterized protein YecE (DUF72 family)